MSPTANVSALEKSGNLHASTHIAFHWNRIRKRGDDTDPGRNERDVEPACRTSALATTISLAVSAVSIAAVIAASRPALPYVSAIVQSPWWVWFSGLIGVIYITAALILAPKLGASVFLGAVVAGQMVAAALLDHYGWVGFPDRSVTLPRLVGAALVVGGVFVMQAGPRSTTPPAIQTPASITTKDLNR